MNYETFLDLGFALEMMTPALIALVCGALIGAERARSGRPAGMRTYALVCFSSALVMAFVHHPSFVLEGVASGGPVRTIDPTRIIQGVVTGVGFLGAGMIFRDGMNVHGLTTASAVFTASVIGIVIGMGFVPAGVLATAATVALLSSARFFEWLASKARYTQAGVAVNTLTVSKQTLLDLIQKAGFEVVGTNYEMTAQHGGFKYTFVLRTHDEKAEERLADSLQALPGVLWFHLAPSAD